MSAVRLADLTSEEVQAARGRARVAILPVGATEQHGPHLAVATDARIAEAFAERLGDELGSDALVCPPVPYGLSEHHAAFPGTLTLTPSTFIAVMSDLVKSLSSQGFERIVIVNGHGGNMEALSLVSRQVRYEDGIQVASIMWAKLARDVCAAEAVGTAYGHACELETSLAMALAPELVRKERIVAPDPMPQIEPLSAPPAPFVDVAVRFDEITHDGVYGNPQHANVELGQRILQVALERAVAFTRSFTEGTTAAHAGDI